jgi:hypothetical protein
MKLLARQIFLILFILISHSIYYSTAFACKYTVRDIGFTDLGSSPYQLYFYVDDQTPEEMVSAFQRIAYAALLDANIETETIHTDQPSQNPAMNYFRSQKNAALPVVILANSYGNQILLPFSYTNENYKEAVWKIIENVVTSPLRKKIIDLVANTYGAVLLIEGKNNQNNRRAKNAISTAIEDISQVLQIMPKPIKEPPQIVVISWQVFDQEKVLLWSLDVNVTETDEPQIVILYGRGRRIGPVIKGTDISKENLFSLLAIIGADCECGLDRSIMLGRMIPLRWERKIQSDLVKSLGFDVENPMVKSEMSQILSMTPSIQGNKNALNPLMAYREGIVKFDNIPSVPTVSSDPFRADVSSESEAAGSPLFRMGMILGGGIIVIVLAIAGIIFVRTKRRKS